MHVATTCHTSLIVSGPTAHWVDPETLVGLWVRGREVDTLANSGSQVNTVMPGYVHQHEFPVLLLLDLVNHPLNLVGLGGTKTRPLGFVILRVQVNEIAGYDKDVVFLMVPDEVLPACPYCDWDLYAREDRQCYQGEQDG